MRQSGLASSIGAGVCALIWSQWPLACARSPEEKSCCIKTCYKVGVCDRVSLVIIFALPFGNRIGPWPT